MKTTLNTLLALSFSFSTFAADPVVNLKLLKERRAELILPSYSLENKSVVVDQARLILGDVFVHRALKLENFGTQVDALPLLKELESKMKDMDETSFHTRMMEIFQLQHDLHTSYQMPYPYLCYRSYLPVEFKEVIGADGVKVVAVKGVLSTEANLKVLPDHRVVEILKEGDVLLNYDGQKIEDALRELEVYSGGANPAAIRRVAVSSLGFSSQKYSVIPGNDQVSLTLKNRFGKVYSVVLPWISKENETCLKDNKPAVGMKEVSENDIRNEINEIFRENPKPHSPNKSLSSEWKKTGDPILRYKIINNEFGRFGLFDLDSFSPGTLSSDELILEFKKILETDFAKTDGVIIDLRDNGGGYISLAEGLVQLFNPKNTQPAGFRLRATTANSHYVNNTLPENSPFRTSLAKAVENRTYYTEPELIDAAQDMNRLGQFYFRPVALINNASCYSSCDLFSALMQDHAGAVIFGEDPNTGAGGANNVQLTGVLSALGAENYGPFKKLPRGQNIGFAFRQMLRTGPHAGELIEDVGVKADFLAEARISDLYNESSDQFKIVSRKLNEMSGDFVSSVKFKNNLRQDLVRGVVPTLFASWEQTSNLIFKNNGKVIGEETIELDNLNGREISLGAGVDTSAFIFGEVEIIGMLDQKRVWRKMVTYRVIPPFQAFPENGIEDFSLFSLYTSKVSEGWYLQNGALIVGKGKYSDGTHTEAALFLELPLIPKKLSFEAIIKTEKDYDFFQVLGIVDEKEIPLTAKLSGSLEKKSYEADLSPYIGKKIEIRFVFDADNGVVDEGVQITNLKI